MGVPMYGFPVGHYGPPCEPWPGARVEVRDMLYVLGRVEDVPCRCLDCRVRREAGEETCKMGAYFIQGIFTEEAWAVGAAQDETYFVGPLPPNVALPHHLIQWAGLYFPVKAEEVEFLALFAEDVPTDFLNLFVNGGPSA